MRKFNIDLQQQETFFVLKTTFFMFAVQYLFALVNIYFRNSFLKIFSFPERNTRENVGTFSERFSAGAFFRRFLIEINCPLVSLSLSVGERRPIIHAKLSHYLN